MKIFSPYHLSLVFPPSLYVPFVHGAICLLKEIFIFFVQLMDMGFSREHAMEALLNTSTMEQATEYLLTHPPPLLGGAVRVSLHRQKHIHTSILCKFRLLTLFPLFHLGPDYV